MLLSLSLCASFRTAKATAAAADTQAVLAVHARPCRLLRLPLACARNFAESLGRLYDYLLTYYEWRPHEKQQQPPDAHLPVAALIDSMLEESNLLPAFAPAYRRLLASARHATLGCADSAAPPSSPAAERFLQSIRCAAVGAYRIALPSRLASPCGAPKEEGCCCRDARPLEMPAGRSGARAC